MPLAPATWVETDSAAGSICATAEDMAAYARLLLQRGRRRPKSLELRAHHDRRRRGRGGLRLRLRRSTSRSAATGALIGHEGAMVGFSSELEVDARAGIGAVVLCNMIDLVWIPRKIIDAALALVTAAVEGRELPEPPSEDRASVPDAGAYAGTYRSQSAELVVRADGDRLTLLRDEVMRRGSSGWRRTSSIRSHPSRCRSSSASGGPRARSSSSPTGLTGTPASATGGRASLRNPWGVARLHRRLRLVQSLGTGVSGLRAQEPAGRPGATGDRGCARAAG